MTNFLWRHLVSWLPLCMVSIGETVPALIYMFFLIPFLDYIFYVHMNPNKNNGVHFGETEDVFMDMGWCITLFLLFQSTTLPQCVSGFLCEALFLTIGKNMIKKWKTSTRWKLLGMTAGLFFSPSLNEEEIPFWWSTLSYGGLWWITLQKKKRYQRLLLILLSWLMDCRLLYVEQTTLKCLSKEKKEEEVELFTLGKWLFHDYDTVETSFSAPLLFLFGNWLEVSTPPPILAES